jgi:hypothetical protein
MRSIETDPANGILPMPNDLAWVRVAASPVPDMVLELRIKYRPKDLPPAEPAALRELAALRQDPRMQPGAIAGANPNDGAFWRRVTLTEREREEVRRVMQREQWSEREIKFVINRFSNAALMHVIEFHRKQVLGIKTNIQLDRTEMSHLLDHLKLSREELSAFAALEKHDRKWIAKLMMARATSPREVADAHQRKLDQVQDKMVERDIIQMHEKRVEAAAQHLAAYFAANAYMAFKKSG